MIINDFRQYNVWVTLRSIPRHVYTKKTTKKIHNSKRFLSIHQVNVLNILKKAFV